MPVPDPVGPKPVPKTPALVGVEVYDGVPVVEGVVVVVGVVVDGVAVDGVVVDGVVLPGVVLVPELALEGKAHPVTLGSDEEMAAAPANSHVPGP